MTTLTRKNIEQAFASQGLTLYCVSEQEAHGSAEPLVRWVIDSDALSAITPSAIEAGLADLGAELVARWSEPPSGEFDDEDIRAIYRLPSQIEAVLLEGSFEKGTMCGSIGYYRWDDVEDTEVGLRRFRITQMSDALLRTMNSIAGHIKPLIDGNPDAPRVLVKWLSRQMSGAFGTRLLSALAVEAAGASKDAAVCYLRESSSRIGSISGIPTVDMDGDEGESVVSISWVTVEMVGSEVANITVVKDAVEACYFVDDVEVVRDWDKREFVLAQLSKFFGVSCWETYWSVLYGLLMASTEKVEIVVDNRLPRRTAA